MDDRPEQEKMQHRDRNGETNPTVLHMQRGAKEIQLQQKDRQTFRQRALSITHPDDLAAQRAKFNLYLRERWKRKGDNRETRRKPNQVSQSRQFTQTKLKMATGRKTQCSKLFLCSPLYNLHRGMSVHMYTVMSFCSDINKPALLHMFLHTQELARHAVLS